MFHVSRVVGKLCVYIEDSGGDRREEWKPSVVETRIRSCVVKKKVGVFENCRKSYSHRFVRFVIALLTDHSFNSRAQVRVFTYALYHFIVLSPQGSEVSRRREA